MAEMVRYVVTICRHHAGLSYGHPMDLGVGRGNYGWVPWVEIVEKVCLKFGLWVDERFIAGVLVVDPHRPGTKLPPRLEYLVAKPNQASQVMDGEQSTDPNTCRDTPRDEKTPPTIGELGASVGTEQSNLATDPSPMQVEDPAPANKRVRTHGLFSPEKGENMPRSFVDPTSGRYEQSIAILSSLD